MSKLEIISKPEVVAVFENYPDKVRNKLEQLRALILETAEETAAVSTLTECLKWGEPSYVTKKGSTIRMDWKAKAPTQYGLYFQCNSRLVDTFRLVFDDIFQYEGKRAIILKLNQKIPEEPLKKCITAALIYHDVKHLMTLGI